ncbi:hypothetical protein [Candidatus Poriferisocius sp.]|uniref:hypothetical protein n=1 Tax=Candidatus Poriferisocius sp. TaxID=3101276 RepID=UPI003B020242
MDDVLGLGHSCLTNVCQFHAADLCNSVNMTSSESGKKSDSLGPPWLVILVQIVVALAILRVALWLIPLSGQWDFVVWIGVGVPLAAAAHRFNKARYGAATRAPLWAGRKR